MSTVEKKVTLSWVIFRPFILTVLLVILDQALKLVVIRTIRNGHIGVSLMKDLLWIVHTRNLGMAFSLGDGFPTVLRRILFSSMSMVVSGIVTWYYFRASDLTMGMRWALAGILAGGLGNLVDRVFRPLGVVDFISFKFFGILGMERWPAFNVADASVVVSGISLVILFFIHERRSRE